MQAPREVSRAGMATTSRRRRRVSSSRASARARPMWPWLARAAYDAVSTPSPSVAHQEVGHVLDGRGGEHDQPGAGADRRQDVLDGRRAQQPDGALGRLLDRLEQRVGGLVGEPVGVLHDHDLPAVAHRRQRRAADQVAHLVDADGELLGAGDPDVGVRADRDLVARVALAAPTLLALQPRGEGDRGVGAARPGRAGEQPGVRHVAGHGSLQPFDRPRRWPTSPSQTVPERCRSHGGHRRAPASSGATRPCTASAISSAGARASSTR